MIITPNEKKILVDFVEKYFINYFECRFLSKPKLPEKLSKKPWNKLLGKIVNIEWLENDRIYEYRTYTFTYTPCFIDCCCSCSFTPHLASLTQTATSLFLHFIQITSEIYIKVYIILTHEFFCLKQSNFWHYVTHTFSIRKEHVNFSLYHPWTLLLLTNCCFQTVQAFDTRNIVSAK